MAEAILDPETLDAIIISALSGVLDRPEQHLKRFREAEPKSADPGYQTGLAQLGGYGADVIADVQTLAVAAWNLATDWWAANHGNVEAGILVGYLFELLQKHKAGNGKLGNRTSAPQLIEEERVVITRKLAEEVTVVFLKKNA